MCLYSDREPNFTTDASVFSRVSLMEDFCVFPVVLQEIN
jgi:hypothetical protein